MWIAWGQLTANLASNNEIIKAGNGGMMKTTELSGAILDHYVAVAEGWKLLEPNGDFYEHTKESRPLMYVLDWMPQLKWEQSGPIIEREAIGTFKTWDGVWMAAMTGPAKFADFKYPSATMLEAAMRCFVASKFGDEVPDEIIKG